MDSIGTFVGCPPWGCGSNGAWLGDNIIFHELDAHRIRANSAGVSIVSFHDYRGNPLELRVVGDRLVARSEGSSEDFSDTRISGSVLRLQTPSTPNPFYNLHIDMGAPVEFWAGPRTSAPVYKLNYEHEGSGCPSQSLCQPTTDPHSESFSGQALIFTGDRYDADTKTVKYPNQPDDPNSLWFNIACAGTAIAKMHLLRHTDAGSAPGAPPSTLPQRQAVLKMLAADYCGTGRPFTADGHRLLYTYYQPHWERVEQTLNNAGSLDAIWNQDGATCLDTPRWQDEVPDIRTFINHECRPHRHAVLGPCDTPPPYDWESWNRLGYAISANEFPPR